MDEVSREDPEPEEAGLCPVAGEQSGLGGKAGEGVDHEVGPVLCLVNQSIRFIRKVIRGGVKKKLLLGGAHHKMA